MTDIGITLMDTTTAINQLVAGAEGALRLHARNVEALIEQALTIAGIPPDDNDYATEDENTPAVASDDANTPATPASSPYDSD